MITIMIKQLQAIKQQMATKQALRRTRRASPSTFGFHFGAGRSDQTVSTTAEEGVLLILGSLILLITNLEIL
jgi:hypothetical protein